MKTMLLSTVCALALAGTPVLAQTSGTTTAPSTTTTTTTSPSVASTPSGMFMTPGASDYSASELIGTKVTNRANESVGEIADVMLDANQKVHAVIVSVGGFLGVGTRYVAVQPSSLTITKKDEKTYTAQMDTTKDALKAAPEFKYTRKAS
jgi:sporulation protein YlmC with PRC-barrel domain